MHNYIILCTDLDAVGKPARCVKWQNARKHYGIASGLFEKTHNAQERPIDVIQQRVTLDTTWE